MSRSGYTDDCEHLEMWRGAVRSAMRGARGQAFLRELAATMDAMPEKALAADSLVDADGDFCTLGVIGNARGIDMSKIDPDDYFHVAESFGIARAMAQEIMYENDEAAAHGRYVDGKWTHVDETPQERWQRMRAWVGKHLTEAASTSSTQGKTR